MPELKVWAPKAAKLEVELRGRREAMHEGQGGWWSCSSPALEHGADYALWIDGEGPRPDPRSASQPAGIHGPSRWVDHSLFPWHDAEFQACPLDRAVIYELHIGTFTEEGTFDAACEGLAELAALGITHVEVMPVAEFAGTRGWGYDGVNLFAPHHAYGGPDGFKRFVDACHGAGLGVILDVVYNHLGPVGNYLACFGPYFTDAHRTPWGDAINLDGEWSHEVRNYFIDNALMWLRDYHVDGLRLDAVHALMDRSAIHFMEQLASEVRTLGTLLGRTFVLIAECDLNDPRYVRPVAEGGYGADAQWNEDFHHALHTLLTGEKFGYYEDFGKLSDLAQCLSGAYCYDDRFSTYRKRRHGRPATGLDGTRFVAYLQNHDQIGNRGEGERVSKLIDAPRQKLGAAVTLLSPFVPMLFQGEEWAASAPFQYFTCFDEPELCQAVREGRRKEFAAFGWDSDKLPDPQDVETWRRSQLRRAECAEAPHADMLAWYRELLALRRAETDFRAGPLDPDGVDFDPNVGWLRFTRGRFVVLCNFSGVQQHIACDVCASPQLRLASDPGVRVERNGMIVLPPWGVAVAQVMGERRRNARPEPAPAAKETS